jgi:hypothetical protein
MTNGILMVVFGEGYDIVGSRCVRHSRKHTDLPFHILADHRRTPRWQGISNLTWERLRGLKQEDNRRAKLRAPWHTPFDKTLYLDCDSLIQNPGVDLVFRLLESNDVALFSNYYWQRGDKVLHIYARAMRKFGCSPPIQIWQGGVVGFRKSNAVKALFERWVDYWDRFGRQREMPCLACAAQKTKLKIGMLPEGFFGYAGGLQRDAVVQHWVPGFAKKFNVPKWKKQAGKHTRRDFSWEVWK